VGLALVQPFVPLIVPTRGSALLRPIYKGLMRGLFQTIKSSLAQSLAITGSQVHRIVFDPWQTILIIPPSTRKFALESSVVQIVASSSHLSARARQRYHISMRL
jgi:hypothetical protein